MWSFRISDNARCPVINGYRTRVLHATHCNRRFLHSFAPASSVLPAFFMIKFFYELLSCMFSLSPSKTISQEVIVWKNHQKISQLIPTGRSTSSPAPPPTVPVWSRRSRRVTQSLSIIRISTIICLTKKNESDFHGPYLQNMHSQLHHTGFFV